MNGGLAFGAGIATGGAGLYAAQRQLSKNGNQSPGGSHNGSGASADHATSNAMDMNSLDLGSTGAGSDTLHFAGRTETAAPQHNCPGGNCCADKAKA